jgi:hypothetical protein
LIVQLTCDTSPFIFELPTMSRVKLPAHSLHALDDSALLLMELRILECQAGLSTKRFSDLEIFCRVLRA